MAPLNPDRIELSWRAPRPVEPGDCSFDPGGWIYRIFRDGRLAVSGSDVGELDAVKARVTARAASIGLHNLPYHVSPPAEA